MGARGSRGPQRAGRVLRSGGRAGAFALVLGGALAAGCALPGTEAFRGARLYESGTEALERGETARAVAELERAAALVPHASEVRNHLGAAYAAAGRHEAALRAFRRAVALDCRNAAARRNLRGAQRRAILAEEGRGEAGSVRAGAR